MRGIFLLAFGSAVAAAMPGVSLADSGVPSGPLLTGQAAFGTWQQSVPGIRRLIRPNDLPAPFQTTSASNAPGLVPMPAGAAPKVAAGFSVQRVATGYQQPRVIRTAPNGDLFVADSAANTVHVLRIAAGSAKPSEDSVFADGLNQPYGIAFFPPGPDPRWVYVANTGSVLRYPYRSGDLKATGGAETVVASLPAGYHWTRDLAFTPDGSRLLVSVGSNSNIGDDVKDSPKGGIATWAVSHAPGAMWGPEEDRADVLSFTPDGKDKQVYATGIRNCSGLAIQPATGEPWCVTNERDELGDNVPPDYATHVAAGAFYGWPWYYIGNHEDPRAPLRGQRPDLAGKVATPDVLIQAHSAPLGIVFYDGEMFPAGYKGDAFVTLHGSWNRGARTGYKVVRLVFKDGKPTGEYDDFMTGFVLSADQVWGRPVGVTIGRDGSLFVTEDGSGTIWRVSHEAGPT
jgi:glucose/arabinose dehydrogenase